MKKLMYIAAALLVLVGCNNKEEINGTQNPPAQIVTITGGIDFSSQDGARKVAAKDGWEDVVAGQEVEFIWEMGDEIAVISLDKSEIKKFTVSKIFEGGKAAEFIGEALSSMDQYAVIYPYDLDIDPSKSDTWYLNQKYEGKLRPAAMGMGRENSFMLDMFHIICDLPLTGDIKLGKIEAWVIGQEEKLVKTAAVFMPEGGLQLSSTPQHVTFSLNTTQKPITFRFYDTENNMIMEKKGNYTKPSGKGQKDPIVTFPVLEVKPDAPATTPTLADALVEGATFALGVDMLEGTKTAFMEFIYQYNGEEFVCTDLKQRGRSIIEPDDPGSAAYLAVYSKVTLPSENIIRFEFMPGIQEGYYIEFNVTTKQYEISEKLANDYQCSFGENGYIKVNDVNILGDLTVKPIAHK